MESPNLETYGKRLLPHIVDARAKAGYSQPFAMYAKSIDAAEGFRSVSYAQIANAVNRASWWLDTELGEKEHTFVYFGPNDLRYIIFVLATIKTGRKVI
jgi:acyl-coenzyme A synthetase/AMP-(fatty) acid ligase